MKKYLIVLLYLITGLVIVVGGGWASNKLNEQNNSKSTSSPVPTYTGVTCPVDFSSYQSLAKDPIHVVKLIGQRKNMFAQNGQFVNTEVVITKNNTQQSKVACGYLYIKAGTQDYGALQSWEYIYINPDLYGGHIYTTDSFNSGNKGNFSEYIIPLSRIQYWKYNTDIGAGKQTLLTADWTSLLNVSNQVKFNIDFNTNDNSGYIDEVSIAYKCWNPITGQENNGCKLTIVSTNDIPINNPF